MKFVILLEEGIGKNVQGTWLEKKELIRLKNDIYLLSISSKAEKETRWKE